MLDLPIVCVCSHQIRMYPLARNHARFNRMGKHYWFQWSKVNATYLYSNIMDSLPALHVSSYTGKKNIMQVIQFSLKIFFNAGD